jgi:hypothetical protein
MAATASSPAMSGPDSVVVASFDSYRHCEHMLASLGAGFRRTTRKGGTTAVVVRGNADGSLKLAQSRVLTASRMVSALMRVSLSWLVGFMGLLSMLKGAKRAVHAGHVHERHVGSDAHRAHEILAEAGPRAAIVVVRCEDWQTRQKVTGTPRLPSTGRSGWQAAVTGAGGAKR